MKEKLLEASQGLVDTVVAAAPKVAMGIVLFVVAVIVAKIAEKVLRAILVRVRFDNLVKKAGIDKTLQRMGLRRELNQFIPRLVYFLLLFMLAKVAADVLGLVAISEALSSFFNYLPNLIAALLLVILGGAAGQFVGQTVTRAGEESGLDFARPLGRLVSGLILFIVGIMALTQLKFDTDMIRLVTSFALAGVVLAFGLSFGLGARDVTRNILAGFYARKVLHVGQRVEISGQRGTLRAVTPTHTQIDSGERTINVSNSRFLDEISTQERADSDGSGA